MYIHTYPSDCITKEVDGYTIVKYPPEKKHVPEYRPFRSVIYKNGTPVSFSPPKSISYTAMKCVLPFPQCIVEEFVEGTMINLFYDESWKIATKSVMHAKCTFNSDQTFEEMFYECVQHNNIILDNLDTSIIYSLVMQHPNNRIVTVVHEPRLILVEAYKIIEGHARIVSVEGWMRPTQYSYDDYQDAELAVDAMTCKGLVFKGGGLRSKLRNQQHEQIEKLKGNMPFKYYYFHIRNKDTSIFKYFPEFKPIAEQYERDVRDCCKTLWQNYKDCFMFKKGKHSEYVFKNFLYEIHHIYINELYPKSMTFQRIVTYVFSLTPVRISQLLQVQKTSLVHRCTLDTPV
jgi:hypothetical protein